MAPAFVSTLKAFYRSCLFQIILVGLVSLSGPGIWMALNSLGAGGQASPVLNNAANALTYGLMSVGCTVAGGVANRITPRWALVLGAALYTPYAAGLYCNNRFGNEWFLLLGAGLCGVGGALLWASEGAIAVGYPQRAKRGQYVGIWMALRQCGPLVGASISLALNAGEGHRGKVRPETYIGLIALAALGAPWALLLSPPAKVVRSDGTGVPHLRGGATSVAREARAIGRQLKSPYLAVLIPVFLAGEFGITYQGNFLTGYFTVRARALASFLTAVLGFLGNMLTGAVLDLPGFAPAAKSRAVYLFLAAALTTCWAWITVVQARLSRLNDDKGVITTSFDVGQSGPAASAFAVYLLFRFLYEALQTYLYWLMGEVTYQHADGGGEQVAAGSSSTSSLAVAQVVDEEEEKEKEASRAGELARTTGILRSWESLGSTIAYAVGAVGVSNTKQLVLGFVLWGLTVPFTLWAVYGEWAPVKGDIGNEKKEEDEQQQQGGLSDSGEDSASASGGDVEKKGTQVVVVSRG